MRNLSLNIAAIISLLAAITSITTGVIYLASGEGIYGLSLIFLAAPVCIALGVVFDYVGERIRRDQREGNFRSRKDVIDTPWEDDPDHV